MRRKKLIQIALVVVMLFSFIAPMLEAQASSEKTTMTFNFNLYKGIKSYFQEEGISAIFNDSLHTIKMEKNVVDSIEELTLKEKGISDLTGLDVFTSIKKLIISGNELDQKSNLGVLNNLSNLEYLDISSNQISDISEIQELVERLIANDSNSVNLTGQIAKIVVDVPLDSTEGTTTVTYELPQILQFAGVAKNGTIENKGILKSEWTAEKYYTPSSINTNAPYIVASSIPNPVTSTNNTFDIQVGNENLDSFTTYQGLVKWVISIKDTTNSSYNISPASENILKESIFTLYYVVHLDNYEGIIFKDNNLYLAVKEQLTKDQTINSDLLSYKYGVDENDDIYCDVCDLSLNGNNATLKINDQIVYYIENFNINGSDRNSRIYYVYNNLSASRYYQVQDYTVEYFETVNESGVVTRTAKVLINHYNENSRNLYVDYYDEANILVITDLDLINKINSLILNDMRINDLSGLEKFIGLESRLNVSYNYIDTMEKIYALQLNKDLSNSNIQSLYSERLNALINPKSKVTESYKKAEEIIKQIRDEIATINSAISEANELDTSAENYDEQLTQYENKIRESEKKINGDGTSENLGLISQLEKALNDPSTGLNPNLAKVYLRLSAMYNMYNREYKLTTLLVPALNYQTEEEYEEFKTKIQTRAGAKELVNQEISRISSLENANALSSLEKRLIIAGLRLSVSEEEANPISKALNDLVSELEESDAPRTSWTSIINTIKEIDIYSQAQNYCLIERMNNPTAITVCNVEKYLVEKIKEFSYEGINSDLLTAIYEKVSNNITSNNYNSRLYSIFEEYLSQMVTMENGTEGICQGEYNKVNHIGYETTRNDALGVNYTSSIKLTESLDRVGKNQDSICFYEQLLSLANKFTTLNEVSKYVVLPNLKSVDVRNNEIESLGNTEVTMELNNTVSTTTENLATLKELKELYAGHNLISGDIQSVDWSNLTSLKKLELSYNYITDLLPLQVLKNLRYLDVSDNMLEGAFNLRLKEMKNLQNIILAGNKYEDISQILIDYEMEANGDFSRYFSREDTLNIDLSRQELEIEIEEPIQYESNTNVYQVELPPIFSQLEYIDTTRTAYGTTSSKGTIIARGGYAYVPVATTGDYAGIVKVIAANGYPEDVTTSVGIDTTCTIKYSVIKISVDSITIDGDQNRIEAGTSRTYTATVDGENIPDKTVEWDIISDHSEGTTINQEGLLTVAEDETADEIIIEATSRYDDSISATLNIEVFRREVTQIEITGPESIITGKNGEYSVEVTGEDIEEEHKGIEWSISGNTSSNTKIEIIEAPENEDEERENIGGAILTIGNDETADTITIIATSTYQPEKSGSYTVTINKKRITGIEIKGSSKVRTGNSETYIAEVTGEYLDDEDKEVTWKIISPLYARYYNENTKLEKIEAIEGQEVENIGGAKFTVAEEEMVEEFVIEATSVFDGNKYDEFVINIEKKEVTAVEITNATESIITGKSGEYSARVLGNYLDDDNKNVIWSISGNTSSDTKIEKIEAVEGEQVENIGGAKLTIGLNENANTIKVIATSEYDNSKYAEYTVTINKKEITNIKVYEQGVVIFLDGRGKTSYFTEIVDGNYLDDEDKGVTWSIIGNRSEITRITDDGRLIVGEDETSNTITVIATSKFDTSKKGTSVVTILRKEVTKVTVNDQNVIIKRGNTCQYNAVVEGNNLEQADKAVTWSIVGKDSNGNDIQLSNNTSISSNGLLTVGSGEEATTIIIKATSVFDQSVFGTATATISNSSISLPSNLGYTIDSDNDIIGVSPDTSSTQFKTKYVPDNIFTVKVTRNGVEIGANTSVATGDVAVISKDGDIISSNVIVVKGDANGDGTVSAVDSKLVKSHRARLTTLTGIYFKAADVDNNKSITVSDGNLILAHRAKIDGYQL